ncbi:MAG: zinc ribbon domain-containing protein [Desulfamplus sp.]|nr:zinc ribbon domain-containing protein [Desulfamplus sp.]
MPIYEYKCKTCGNNFEALVLGRDVPACSSCHSNDLEKLMSACGFVSKSSGAGGSVQTTSSAGSSCGGCAATSCGTCGSR